MKAPLPIVLAFVVGVFTPGVGHGQAVVTTSIGFDISQVQSALAVDQGLGLLRLQLNHESPQDALALDVSARVRESGRTTLEWNQLGGTFRIGDSATLGLGLLTHRAGTGLFFSAVNFFEANDPFALLEGGGGISGPPSALALLSWIGDGWFLRGIASPFAQRPQLPEITSPWFPKRSIRDSFQVLSTIYRLRTLQWADTTGAGPLIAEPSVGIELGGNWGPLEAQVLGYDGLDRDPVTTATIDLLISPWAAYDITLEPSYSRRRALGATFRYQLDPVQLWVDGAYTFSRQLSALDLYDAAQGWKTGTTTSDVAEVIAGISWTSARGDLFLAAESRSSLYYAPGPGAVPPLLDNVATVVFQATSPDQVWEFSSLVLVSLRDLSGVVGPMVVIKGSESVTTSLTLPLFWGHATSEVGQFQKSSRMKVLVTVAL